MVDIALKILNTLDLLWVLTLFIVGLLFILTIKSVLELNTLKKYYNEKNRLLKEKFNITENLL